MKKTLVITGGSKGIGSATCALFLQQGYQVAKLRRQNKIKSRKFRKLARKEREKEKERELEELKKVTAEENARSNKRRMKFQAQDSVLIDTFGGSQDND